MMENSILVKKCLTNDLLVCHYVHLRMELRRYILYNNYECMLQCIGIFYYNVGYTYKEFLLCSLLYNRLHIELQIAIGKDVFDKHDISKRWDDWISTSIWETLDYDRHWSPVHSYGSMTDPLETYYPHENKFGLQMDSLNADFHNSMERQNHIQPQQLEVSSSMENIHSDIVLQPELVPVTMTQTASHNEQTSKHCHISHDIADIF